MTQCYTCLIPIPPMVRFLILDPHYTGKEDLKIITNKVHDYSLVTVQTVITTLYTGLVRLEANQFLGQ